MPERETIAGIVKMRVVNSRAARHGEVGHVVGFGDEGMDTPLEKEIFILEFADGKRYRYNIVELEVVMP